MEFIHLIGAEDIPRAAGTMREAAQTMSNVSQNMQIVLEAHQRFLDDWLRRFEQALEQDRSERKS